MNSLIAVLFFIGFGVIVGYGNQAKGDRTVLSSQSEDHLTIPEGDFEGAVISRKKTEQAIAEQLDSVSKVHNLSILDDTSDLFHVSFTVETIDGKVFTGINCYGFTSGTTGRFPVGTLMISGCRSNEVKIDKRFNIRMHEILVDSPI